ncbi:MAG: TonB-dependent receptor plug domain-containing protein, partial [Desulfobaccales bacterium]
MKRTAIWMAMAAWICSAALAVAAEKQMDEMLVESERLVTEQGKITIKPEGLPANVNVFTREDVKTLPFTDPFDLFRRAPGVAVGHYGAGDIGGAIGMRGFTGDHGAEVGVYIDGVPMNLVQGSMLNGWVDVGWVIPEMVEKIEVIKGPMSALYGNFSLPGTILITTRKKAKTPDVGLFGGTFGVKRGVATVSSTDWRPTPFLVYEGYHRDGHRDNSDYVRGNFFNKLTIPLWQGDLSLRAHYAVRDWGIANLIFVKDVRAGKDRRDASNSTDFGKSYLFDAVLNYSPKGGEEGFYGTAYFVNY